MNSVQETIEITPVLLSWAREIEETKAVDLTVITAHPAMGGPGMPGGSSEITGHFREDLPVSVLETRAPETCLLFIYLLSMFYLGFVFPVPSKGLRFIIHIISLDRYGLKKKQRREFTIEMMNSFGLALASVAHLVGASSRKWV